MTDTIEKNLSSDKHYYVYIVECSDGTLYTGYTTDLSHRLKAHNCGKGAKYTKVRLPVVLVYQEEVQSKSEALRREYAIKKMSRQKKLDLIEKAPTPEKG